MHYGSVGLVKIIQVKCYSRSRTKIDKKRLSGYRFAVQ